MERWIELQRAPGWVIPRSNIFDAHEEHDEVGKITRVKLTDGKEYPVMLPYAEVKFLITAPIWMIWARSLWRWIRRAK